MAPASDNAASIRMLAVGRQGYGNKASRRIADAMEAVAAGIPTHGVLYLGDNFYPRGVKSVDDDQWQSKFEYLYDGAHLRGMPFFAVIGNHDAEGDVMVQVRYALERRGSGRWQMDGQHYWRDFGRVNGRTLVRVVFLNTIDLQKNPAPELAFARDAWAAPGDPFWRVVAGHYAVRSVTKEAYTRDRTLSALLPEVISMDLDLYISANDRFQQVLDRLGEPLHVSVNGGSDKQEAGVSPEIPGSDFVAMRPGFAAIDADSGRLTVTLYDISGQVVHTRSRRYSPLPASIGR